jgi:hypothetical protein
VLPTEQNLPARSPPPSPEPIPHQVACPTLPSTKRTVCTQPASPRKASSPKGGPDSKCNPQVLGQPKAQASKQAALRPRRTSQRDVLQYRHVVAHHRCLSDDHACAVVQQHALAQLGSWVDVHCGRGERPQRGITGRHVPGQQGQQGRARLRKLPHPGPFIDLNGWLPAPCTFSEPLTKV